LQVWETPTPGQTSPFTSKNKKGLFIFAFRRLDKASLGFRSLPLPDPEPGRSRSDMLADSPASRIWKDRYGLLPWADARGYRYAAPHGAFNWRPAFAGRKRQAWRAKPAVIDSRSSSQPPAAQMRGRDNYLLVRDSLRRLLHPQICQRARRLHVIHGAF
jgi:hypothetical protein